MSKLSPPDAKGNSNVALNIQLTAENLFAARKVNGRYVFNNFKALVHKAFIRLKTDTPDNYKKPAQRTWSAISYPPSFHEAAVKQTAPFVNRGLVLGAAHPNLFVIDVDIEKKAKAQAFKKDLQKALTGKADKEIDTLIVNTKHGTHFFFQAPFPVSINSKSKIDIKGFKSYVAIPPSPDKTILRDKPVMVLDVQAVSKINEVLRKYKGPQIHELNTAMLKNSESNRQSDSIPNKTFYDFLIEVEPRWQYHSKGKDSAGKLQYRITRPGKDIKDGPSATFNGVLKVFTPNSPVPINKDGEIYASLTEYIAAVKDPATRAKLKAEYRKRIQKVMDDQLANMPKRNTKILAAEQEALDRIKKIQHLLPKKRATLTELDSLPCARPLFDAYSRFFGYPPRALFNVYLSHLAAILCNQCELVYRNNEGDNAIKPAIWSLTVAESGVGKSPILKVVSNIFEIVDMQYEKEYLLAFNDYTQKKRELTKQLHLKDEEYKIYNARWKTILKESLKPKPPTGIDAELTTARSNLDIKYDEVEKIRGQLAELDDNWPTEASLTYTSGTTQGLINLLTCQKRGVVIPFDESSGLVDLIKEAKHAASDSFYSTLLSGHAGANIKHVTKDTKGIRVLRNYRLSVSICSVFKTLKKLYTPSRIAEGLYPRTQFICQIWPRLYEEEFDFTPITRYMTDLTEQVFKVTQTPRTFTFTPEAEKLFSKALFDYRSEALDPDHREKEFLLPYTGKQKIALGSLCICFHVLRWSEQFWKDDLDFMDMTADDPKYKPSDVIDEETVRLALNYYDYNYREQILLLMDLLDGRVQQISRRFSSPAVQNADTIISKLPKFMSKCKREKKKPTVRNFTKILTGKPKTEFVESVINSSGEYTTVKDGRATVILKIDIL